MKVKAKIAVATVSGKAYYLIVNELKRRNTSFLSLVPGEPVPLEIKVVITTEKEKARINHEKILVYKDGINMEALIEEALRIAQGKENYEKVVIGVDPGKVFGLAVLADGKVVRRENCFSVKEALNRIISIVKNFRKMQVSSIRVKIGNGVPEYKEKLLKVLDKALPLNVVLESVSEAGTNRYTSEEKHRRGMRDIVSAIRIAGRNGQIFQRRRKSAEES
ncbi:hypothetical protein J7L49_06695 [Candidatus Bathyarchaeota archaeon]|nr:hypothetical protein [Candidatus Bathyarchaeota archaeon]